MERKNTFCPHERARAKQQAREEDDRAIASGEVTREEVARRNSFFGAFDLSKWRIVSRRRSVVQEREAKREMRDDRAPYYDTREDPVLELDRD